MSFPSYFCEALELKMKGTQLDGSWERDEVATSLFPSDGPACPVPVKTYGDGNCLFRAVAQCVYGEMDHTALVHVAPGPCCRCQRYRFCSRSCPTPAWLFLNANEERRVPHPFVLTNIHTVNESSSGGKPYIGGSIPQNECPPGTKTNNT